MVTTIKELAKLAGVTETTVSLSFQNSPRISDKTRSQILRLAGEMGYVPNRAARQLRQGHTRIKNLGMLVNDITNPFFSLMVQAAEQVAARRGYQVTISDSQWTAEKEVLEIKNLIEARTDGVLACFCEKTSTGIELLEKFSVPYLVLDTCPPEYQGAFVGNDLAEAGRLGARHLADIGCRRPAFLTSDKSRENFSSFQAMQKEFERTLRINNIEFLPHQIVNAGLTIDAGRQACHEVSRLGPEVDGVFCVNTLCALGYMEAARQAGQVPAIMGVDDLDICALSFVSLTTIRQPYEQLAQIATDVLINSIEEKKSPTVKMSLKPELVIRESTRRPKQERTGER
jgi:LacI family transcriptional regulator